MSEQFSGKKAEEAIEGRSQLVLIKDQSNGRMPEQFKSDVVICPDCGAEHFATECCPG